MEYLGYTAKQQKMIQTRDASFLACQLLTPFIIYFLVVNINDLI